MNTCVAITVAKEAVLLIHNRFLFQEWKKLKQFRRIFTSFNICCGKRNRLPVKRNMSDGFTQNETKLLGDNLLQQLVVILTPTKERKYLEVVGVMQQAGRNQMAVFIIYLFKLVVIDKHGLVVVKCRLQTSTPETA